MAKIPLPERGQPLDLSYLREVANAVNDLSDLVAPSSYTYVSVDTPNAGTQYIRSSEAKIVAGYVEVATNSAVAPGREAQFIYNFSADYKFPPIVTATAVNVNGSSAGQNVSVALRFISTNRVEGVVRFNEESANVSLGVNLIIVGIPN
jgi:hypothetical protein